MKDRITRRRFLQASGAGVLSATSLAAIVNGKNAYAESGKTLTIAYNTSLPSLDPTSSAKTSSPAALTKWRRHDCSAINQTGINRFD